MTETKKAIVHCSFCAYNCSARRVVYALDAMAAHVEYAHVTPIATCGEPLRIVEPGGVRGTDGT